MKTKKVSSLYLACVLILILAGCGGSQALSSPQSSLSKPLAVPAASTILTPSAASPTSASAAPNTVTMGNRKFIPSEITISKGETVTWINTDSIAHNVVGNKFNSGTLGRGQSFSYTFNEAGTFDYVCTFHPGMTGKVIVK